MPRPLNQKATSCLSLEVEAPPRTETNEVLEGLEQRGPRTRAGIFHGWGLLRACSGLAHC